MAFTPLQGLEHFHSGKVRETYLVNERRLLQVATDRLSAFDVVLEDPIPGKGKVLTDMALFWMKRLAYIVPHHLTDLEPEDVVIADDAIYVVGRSLVVQKLRPIPCEAVVRGHLAGTGWKDYQATRAVCGIPLPPGLQNGGVLPEPIFTPSTKAPKGQHDQNVTFEQMVEILAPFGGREIMEKIKAVSLAIYNEARAYAYTRGIIIADTKFEFGLDDADRLVLMDEVLTPDSSRFWPIDGYEQALAMGTNPPSYDKQFVRDWLEAYRDELGKPWDKKSPAPALPPAVVADTAQKYRQAYEALCLN